MEKSTRVRVRKRLAESGGKEGSGGGYGEGKGGGEASKKVDGEGANFSFGRMAEKSMRSASNPLEYHPGSQSGPSKLSYRDKLLSPGCAGFLVKHYEEDDLVQGWKEYFHRMNEKDTRCGAEESDEEGTEMARRLEGKPGALKFTADEYTAWCLPWMNSLIIKEDKEYAFQEGPWMIDDHYLIVQRWRPNFNPWKADLQCNIAAWIRLPDVPFEFYNVESLRRIGNMVGRMIKIDRSTSIYEKGGFARICVEIDLKQPLLPSYMVFGEERHIIYEGLHQVCFGCGKYGHKKKKKECPLRQNEHDGVKENQQKVASDNVDGGGDKSEKAARADGGHEIAPDNEITGDSI
ncbi:hypothetical protein K1719_001922 [Acacia pycnantha]|nr:hypothetical protein K1719_001922 [Acacia pycnantha]